MYGKNITGGDPVLFIFHKSLKEGKLDVRSGDRLWSWNTEEAEWWPIEVTERTLPAFLDARIELAENRHTITQAKTLDNYLDSLDYY